MRPNTWRSLWLIMIVVSRSGLAQESPDSMIKLNLPHEIEIKALIDYVSERHGLQILYDEKIANKKLTIYAPKEIPAGSLVSLLESALRIKGLLLVDADTPGWKRIVDSSRLIDISTTAAEEARSGVAVTKVFVLQHVDPTQFETSLKQFLTSPGGNSIALKEQRILIVTDYANTVQKIARLIELIDRPRASPSTRFIKLKHTAAEALAQQLTGLLEARAKNESTTPAANSAATGGVGVVVFHDARTNQLILIGSDDAIEQVQRLVRVLDVPLALRSDVYAPKNLSVERFERMAQALLPEIDRKRLFQSSIDAEQNLVVISTTNEVHAELAKLLDKLDTSTRTESKSRVKFYKLKHVNAKDALETLRAIEGGIPEPQSNGPPAGQNGYELLTDISVPGPNRPVTVGRRELPLPPGMVDENGARAGTRASPLSAPPTLPNPLPDRETVSVESVLGRARVTADVNSNTLIVIGDPVAQKLYSELIESIDLPRPQVLIEAKVVTLDTSDGFGLGVEFSGGDRTGQKKLFSFTSFGLSQVNPVNGALAIIPGTGFNGTLVDPDVADVVLRAFTTHRRAKVVSAPRVLVSDNAEGQLESVTEIPFTSVNASQTVATTSFAGFAKAGTTIRVTPHISVKDQLQLEFVVELNDFQGQSTSANVPPPRTTDKVESIVTIPDGHTLIVGGLNRSSSSYSMSSLPFLEYVPLFNSLYSNTTKNLNQTSLFIFIRPVILRDDKFRELKHFSERDTNKAEIFGDYPVSRPVLIR